ncbi:MAG: BolA family protein [Gammaproteobacteria bacterium]
MITTIHIKTAIETALSGSTAIIQGDDGVHFDAVVIAEQFTGISKVKQQQLVYQALHDAFRSGELHALALKTYTPTEWDLQRSQQP